MPHARTAPALGNVTVYAASFSGSTSIWTTSGTIWLGDYVILSDATLALSNSALSGSGLFALVTAADGSASTALFRDSFDINTGSGVLTPRLLNLSWRVDTISGAHTGAQIAAGLPVSTTPPSQVQLTVSDGAMTVSWAGSPSADVIGYRLYYRHPGGGAEFMSDTPTAPSAATFSAASSCLAAGRWRSAPTTAAATRAPAAPRRACRTR